MEDLARSLQDLSMVLALSWHVLDKILAENLKDLAGS